MRYIIKWFIALFVLIFTGCAPGLAPMGMMADPNFLMMAVLIVVVIFGIYLFNKKDGKQGDEELLKRVEKLEKEIKELKDRL